MKTFRTLAAGIFLFAAHALWAQSTVDITGATESTIIKNTSPAYISALGIDPNRLNEFGTWNIQNNWGGQSLSPKSCIVIKDGVIIGEWYGDRYGNPVSPQTASKQKAKIYGGSQTLAMLLFEKLTANKTKYNIPDDFSLSAKLYDARWIPDNISLNTSLKEKITFDDVFRHASGLMPESAGNERGEEKSRIAFTFGLDKKHPLSSRLYFTPGHPESYRNGSPYSSLAYNHLSVIFKTLTGIPAWKLLENELLHPLGITDIGYSTKLESTYQPWQQDSIRWIAADGLWLRPVDLSKIGLLLANGGLWNGKEIVPNEWISRFTESGNYPDMLANRPDGFWTNGHRKGKGFRPYQEQYPEDMIAFSEEGLTWVYVIPSKNMVVVRTSEIFGVNRQEIESRFLTRLFSCFGESLLAGIKSASGLLPDPLNPSRLIYNTSPANDSSLNPAYLCTTVSLNKYLDLSSSEQYIPPSSTGKQGSEISLHSTEINSSWARLTFYDKYPFIAFITPRKAISSDDDLHQKLVLAGEEAAGRFSLVLNEDPVYKQLAMEGKTDEIRKRNWAVAMSGTHIIIPVQVSGKDSVEIKKSNRILKEFMENSFFNYVAPKDELALGGSKYILGNQGSVYIIYTPKAGKNIGIKSIKKGTYDLKWLDCKTGKTLEGKFEIGDTNRYVWDIPEQMGEEVALYLVNDQFKKAHRKALTSLKEISKNLADLE